MRFDDFDLSDELLDGLDAMNFFNTTPIQAATIPALLEGRDMIACAPTGTGKTAAYLLPIIEKLTQKDENREFVRAVIMAPTRELAQQIDQQIAGFAYFLPISAVAIYGGTDGIAWEQQSRGMKLGADIVVATPGRLISLLQLDTHNFSRVEFFVLDEADRMLDMGFFEDIMQIHQLLPSQCQKVMFSATMPAKIKNLAESILHDPVSVEIELSKPPASISQRAYVCYEAQKLPILRQFFIDNPPNRTLIFTSSKVKTRELMHSIRRLGFNAADMHSDLAQTQREQVMRDFKNGYIDVLVATDIVSRGIDIDNIEVVINYDIPRDPEDYVHRIGRTARGTNGEGIAITFVSEDEQRDFGKVERFLGREVEKLPIDNSFGPLPEYRPFDRPAGRGQRYASSNSKRRQNARRKPSKSVQPTGESTGPQKSNTNKRRSRSRSGRKKLDKE